MFARCLFAALALSATPALADLADCEADLAAIAAMLALPAADPAHPLAELLPEQGGIAFEDGRCLIPQLEVPIAHSGYGQKLVAGPIRWQIEWADEGRRQLPKRLVLDVERAVQVPVPKRDGEGQLEQIFAYQMKISAPLNAMRLGVDLSYDNAAGTLAINRFDGQIGPGNRLALTGRLSALPADLTPDQLLPKDLLALATINALDLKVTNSGLFENSSVSWMMLIFPGYGDSPEQAVQNAQAMSRAWIAGIPDSLTTAEDRAQLTAMIDAIPNPQGELHLTLDAPRGLSPSRIESTLMAAERPGWAAVDSLLQDARLTARWTPTTLTVVPAP